MQIAQIVPKVRTRDEGVFDYSIPPELLPMIKPGILVEVPFHGRKLEGIIIKLKSKSPIANLKSILNIVDPNPTIDEIHIKLAQWMSDYYLTPLGKTLFEFIVPPAKRTIKKINTIHTTHTTQNARALRVVSRYLKKYLIIGDFSTRLKFYLQAIIKTLAKNQSIIILVPDLSLISYFTRYLKNPYSILQSGMTKTQRWLEWDKIRRNDVKVIIGSQSALFAPVKNLGLVIIDQEENETYKNDRSPRYHTVRVAEELAKITDANLVLGSLTPRVETYFNSLKGAIKILRKKSDRGKMTPKIIIVDMNSEKYIISNVLEKDIENTLQNHQKILLILNRKGEGTKFSCADCGWIALCEKCGLPLIPQKAENVCYRCQKNYPPQATCPKCRGVHLKPMGLGTARLKKILSDLFPKAKIIQVEKEIDGTTAKNDWDIAITTSYGLKFNWPKIGLVGIIDADQGLNFPDFNSPRKIFQTLYKFLRIGERGVIQTHLPASPAGGPENYVIRALAQLNYEKFFLEELAQRRKYSFPPFVQLIRLLYKNADEEKAKKETQRIYRLLSDIRHKQYVISQPYPCFIEKERGKFRWQIIIKVSGLRPKFSDQSKDILRSLPKGWIVDVDPVNLL